MTIIATVLLAFFLLFALAVVASRFNKTIVFEYERGLRFSKGRLKDVLGPGAYWHYVGSTTIQKIDTRPSRVVIGGQEVLSADGVAIKTSVTATVQIKDAERAVMGTDNYTAAIHTELQLALRALASSLPIEELLQKRADIAAELKKTAAPPLAAIGIELQDAALRDLTFPGELKKIFAQVVKARQEGLAALEKARGETAALRNLANAASLIERNPSLMQLRALQVLAQQPGNTLVLGMQQGAPVIPLRDRATPPELPAQDAEPPSAE
ncbi:MAG TPA: slipin family protein [Vicinamibacterales bacterium]|jgi:regulator of protease activity HflC (stomatin/prohibitin superfamily)